jgi:hypothetical protein
MRAHLLFLPVVCLLLGGGIAQSACNAASRQGSGPRYEVGQEVEVEGVVVENVLDCVRDLSCYLRLKTGEGEVAVEYAAPRGTPCPNTAAGDQGMEIRQGARVRVFARATGSAELSTCPDHKYTLTPIQHPEP